MTSRLEAGSLLPGKGEQSGSRAITQSGSVCALGTGSLGRFKL